MFSVRDYLSTTIAKKKLMGVTGLVLSGFLLGHMSGNLFLFLGPDAYNSYGHAIVSNKPLLYGTELVLILSALIHVGLAIHLTRLNRAARPEGYARNATGKKMTALAARTLILSGLLLLAFIVLHLKAFKYGEHYTTMVNGVEMRDLYRLMAEKFAEPLFVGWYLFSLVILGMHLSHGFTASFQSLGLASVRYPKLKKLGYLFAIVVAGGFFAQPIFMFTLGSN